MVAGGFQGELICKVGWVACRLVSVFLSSVSLHVSHSCALLIHQYVDKPGVAFCTNLTGDDNSTTNAVDIYQAPK